MKAGPWVAVLEAFLVKKLLESRAFHRAIGKAHKSVHRLRHGTPPEEMGGTKLETPAGQGWLDHFVNEVKDQAFANRRGVGKKPTDTITSRSQPQQQQQQQQHQYNRPQVSKSDGADHNSQNQGFLSHFMDEIKDQFRSGNKNK